jgi:polysaccharide export outer membrane protein
MKQLSLALMAFSVCAFGQSQSPTAGGSAPTVGPASTAYYQAKPVLPADLSSLMHATAPPLPLLADDVIKVSVYGVKDYNTNVRVAKDGTVQLPLIGPVVVGGLTIEQAEQQIATVLAASDLILNPAVTIEAQERSSEIVVVSGEVAKPGTFPSFGIHTLGEYLAKAGGLLPTASSTITLNRIGRKPIAIPLSTDPNVSGFNQIPVFAGDEITISKTGVFYIVGAVRLQGVYPIKGSTPTTASEAVAIAGGAGYESILDSAQIIRTQGTGRVMLPIHLGKIIHGKEPDVALENDDIVFVPTAQLKAALKGGGSGLIVTLATALIYSH